jgi:hypothetical protein
MMEIQRGYFVLTDAITGIIIYVKPEYLASFTEEFVAKGSVIIIANNPNAIHVKESPAEIIALIDGLMAMTRSRG